MSAPLIMETLLWLSALNPEDASKNSTFCKRCGAKIDKTVTEDFDIAGSELVKMI